MKADPERKAGSEPHPTAAILLLAIGAVIALGALRYEFGSFDNPGAGFVPFFTGLAIAGMLLWALMHRGTRRDEPQATEPGSGKASQNVGTAALIVAAIVALSVWAAFWATSPSSWS